MNTILSGAPMLGRNFSEYKAPISQPAQKIPKAGGGCKTIASDKSEVGSVISGRGSVLSSSTGFMFKCFESMYGAKRMMKNVAEKSNYNGSIRASVIDRVDYDFQGLIEDGEDH